MLEKKYNIASSIVLLLLLILFVFLGFPDVFFDAPKGIHFMRQTDSLSFAFKYYENGFDFFHPQLYNLKNIDGNAACEFPVIYYLAAVLFVFFGKQFFILKLLHLIILYIGIFYVFKLAYLVLQDSFYAGIIGLFLFTSTVLNYYSFNFLPDVAALGFTFIAWYFAIKFQMSDHKKSLLISIIFFTLAGLIKVTYFINPLAFFSWAILSVIFKHLQLTKVENAKKIIALGTISIIIVLAWNCYIIYYNNINESNSFNTKALPIWNISISEIHSVFDHMLNYYYSAYLAHSSYHILALVVIFQLVFIRSTHKMLMIIIGILFFATICYFVLFFSQFKNHDYYALAFVPLIVLLFVNGIYTFLKKFENKYIHILTKFTLCILILIGINYSRIKLVQRFEMPEDIYSKSALCVLKNKEVIEKLNIPVDAKVIVVGDYTQNGSLLFLERRGWIIEKYDDLNLIKIENLKGIGAQYLVIPWYNECKNIDLQTLKYKEIYRQEDIVLFKL